MNKNRVVLACGMTVALGAAGYVLTTPAPQPAAEEVRVAQGRPDRPEVEPTTRPTRPIPKPKASYAPPVRPPPRERHGPTNGRKSKRRPGEKRPEVRKIEPAG